MSAGYCRDSRRMCGNPGYDWFAASCELRVESQKREIH